MKTRPTSIKPVPRRRFATLIDIIQHDLPGARAATFVQALTVLFVVDFSGAQTASASANGSYISTVKGQGSFTLSTSGKSAPLYASSQDYPGVIRVLKHLQTDITRVTGAPPDISLDRLPASNEIVLIGTL